MLQLKQITDKKQLERDGGPCPDYLIKTWDNSLRVALWDDDYEDEDDEVVGCFDLDGDRLYFEEVEEIYEIVRN